MLNKALILLFLIITLSSCADSKDKFYNKNLWDKYHKKNSSTTYNKSLSKLERAQKNHKSYFNYTPYGAYSK